jgi:hypothetical protein
MQIDDIGVVGKCDYEIRDGGANVPDHNAAYDQHGSSVDLSGHQQNKSHGNHGAAKAAAIRTGELTALAFPNAVTMTSATPSFAPKRFLAHRDPQWDC